MKGITVFDPSFSNTAGTYQPVSRVKQFLVAKSKITYIDGEKGVLRYRGYNIEELAQKATFLEVAYLLIFGELPSEKQFNDWETKILRFVFKNNLITL